MYNYFVPQYVLHVPISILRLEIARIGLIHVEPVVLNIFHGCVEAQRANGRAAAQVTVNTLNKKILGR